MKKILPIILAGLLALVPRIAYAADAFTLISPIDGHTTGTIDNDTDEIDMVGGFKENGSDTLSNSVTGSAGTAGALGANGTNCLAGNYPLGTDEAGNAESCTAAGSGADGNAKTLCSDGEFLRGEDATTCRTAAQVISDGGGGDAVLSADQTFSGENEFSDTLKYSTPTADAGEWLRIAADGETVETVHSSALPIDPMLVGISCMQNSFVTGEAFIRATLGNTYYTISNPINQRIMGQSEICSVGNLPNDTGSVAFTTSTIKNLVCWVNSNQGSTCRFDIEVNGSDTDLDCSFSGATNVPDVCQNTTDAINLLPGDVVRLNRTGTCTSGPQGACYFQMEF